MRKYVAAGVSIICAAMVVGWLANTYISNRQSEQSEKQAMAERKAATRKAVSSLALKHNAVVDWRSAASRTFTVDLEESLVRTDGRPVLILARLTDISRFRDGYVARFDVDSGSILLLAECSKAQMQYLRAQDESRQESCGVIVLVKSVERAILRLSKEEYSDGEAGWVEIEMDEGVSSVARGECLDVISFDLPIWQVEQEIVHPGKGS